MTESITPANSIGSGEGIAKYDPVMGIVSRIKKGKRLRDIVGNVKKDLKNDDEKAKRRGV